ncbi:hypothetical protein ACSQ67_014140 [Phaseolus vulgaris]
MTRSSRLTIYAWSWLARLNKSLSCLKRRPIYLIVGFEIAPELVALVHPMVDFFKLNPCKSIVDGKLVGES